MDNFIIIIIIIISIIYLVLFIKNAKYLLLSIVFIVFLMSNITIRYLNQFLSNNISFYAYLDDCWINVVCVI